MNYTLYLGDCLEYMRGMAFDSIDAVITDPPYGLGKRWTGGTWFTRNVYKNDNVLWDKKPPQKIINMILNIKKPTVIWGGNYFVLPVSRCWLCWNKIPSIPTMADFELAWTSLDRPSKAYKGLRNGWKRQHPTEKPVALMKWVLEIISNPGDIIFDPFMGSGTTGVAAMQLGRNFIGCEVDPSYFAIAEKRIELAAKQPQLFTTPKKEHLSNPQPKLFN